MASNEELTGDEGMNGAEQPIAVAEDSENSERTGEYDGIINYFITSGLMSQEEVEEFRALLEEGEASEGVKISDSLEKMIQDYRIDLAAKMTILKCQNAQTGFSLMEGASEIAKASEELLKSMGIPCEGSSKPLTDLVDFSGFDFFAEQEKIGRKIQPLHEVLEQIDAIVDSPREKKIIEMLSRLAVLKDEKPEWNIKVDGKKIEPEIVSEKTWWKRLKFTPPKVEMVEGVPKKVQLITPLSGHYATLAQKTVQMLLQRGIIVEVIDWVNPRNVPLKDGEFDSELYTQAVIDLADVDDPNFVAICQACPATFTAIADLSRREDQGEAVNTPNTVTYIAGPLDTDQVETPVNTFARKHDLKWFEENMIQVIPDGPGKGREVYPGRLQISLFIAQNIGTFVEKLVKLFRDLRDGNIKDAEKEVRNEVEYFCCCDIAGKLYREMIENNFLDSFLEGVKRGSITFKGKVIDPSKITDVESYVVEGTKDSITGENQTLAVKEVLPNGVEGTFYSETDHLGTFLNKKTIDFIDENVTNAIKRKKGIPVTDDSVESVAA